MKHRLITAMCLLVCLFGGFLSAEEVKETIYEHSFEIKFSSPTEISNLATRISHINLAKMKEQTEGIAAQLEKARAETISQRKLVEADLESALMESPVDGKKVTRLLERKEILHLQLEDFSGNTIDQLPELQKKLDAVKLAFSEFTFEKQKELIEKRLLLYFVDKRLYKLQTVGEENSQKLMVTFKSFDKDAIDALTDVLVINKPLIIGEALPGTDELDYNTDYRQFLETDKLTAVGTPLLDVSGQLSAKCAHGKELVITFSEAIVSRIEKLTTEYAGKKLAFCMGHEILVKGTVQAPIKDGKIVFSAPPDNQRGFTAIQAIRLEMASQVPADYSISGRKSLLVDIDPDVD